MRDSDINTHVIELQRTPQGGGNEHADNASDGLLPTRNLKSDDHDSSHMRIRPESRWPRWMIVRDTKELIAFLAVVTTAIPIALLAAFSPTMSANLGSQACLPNGDFIIPGTASIWNPAYFFTITITTQGQRNSWNYTHVRIVDLLWDVLVGRGGQLTLIYMVYRVFSRSLTLIMEKKPVPYPIYSAVAFDTASLHSIWNYLRGFYRHKSSLTWSGSRIFITMALVSLYVTSMPTLFSAMTGYSPLFAPSLMIPPANLTDSVDCSADGGCQIFPCGGGYAGAELGGYGLVPGWGIVIDSSRIDRLPRPAISTQEVGDATYYRQYYEIYRAAYDTLATDPTCYNISSLKDCPATNITSVFPTPDGDIHLDKPLLNIQRWSNDTGNGLPEVFLCRDLIVNTYDLNENNVTGICNAAPGTSSGTSYQWGFSFLILLIVCILQLLCAAILYGLWIDARRHSVNARRQTKKVWPNGTLVWRDVDYPTVIGNVMRMAKQAKDDHGDEVFEWDSWKLREEVWQADNGLRARKTVFDDQVEERESQ